MPGDTTVHRSRSGDPTANTLIERLIAVWEAGSPVPLGELLPPDPTPSMVADVACQEIELKLRARQPVRVADYLAAFPQVAALNDLVVYLLEAEVLGRKKHGPPPALDEYIREFPHLRAELERLFGVSRSALPSSPEGYDLLEEIGRGGMGVIYRARDKALKREVAIKVLQDRFAPDSSVGKRFLEEAQITGQLQHPGIPAIHQVGTLADGRPFLAMKLIKGQTLATLIKDKSEINTLGVFESICQAVGYAHERGVIHRDLKPENVMVGAFGEVQVMDWGLAKFIGAKPTNPTAETQAEVPSTAIEDPRTPERYEQTGVAGTPWYMAPEQAAGEQDKIDARTDVFALGGILCAMLTGKPPIEGADQKAAQVNAVRGETTAAFTRLDAIGFEQELIGLCKKCLGFAPDVRYTTAGELAKVIAKLRAEADDRAKQAELDKARADERALAERKRRRVLFVAGLSIIFTLLLGSGLAIWQAAIATKAAKAEEVAKRAAEASNDELWAGLDIMTADIVGNSLGTQKTVSDEQKKFLTTVLPLYQKLAREGDNDEKTRARVAKAALRVGLIENRLGRTEEGLAAFKIANAVYARLAAEFSAVPEYCNDLSTSHNNLGNLLDNLGRKAEAEEQYRKGLAIQEKLVADIPAILVYRSDLAMSHNNLGILLVSLGKLAEAEEQYKKAIAIQEKLVADSPAIPDYRTELARSSSNLGALLANLGKGVEAEEQFRRGVALREKLADDFASVPDCRAELATSHLNLGILLVNLGKGVEAEEQYKKALAIQEKLAADFPSVPDFHRHLSGSLNSLANLLADLGKGVEAEEQYKKALAIKEKLVEDFPAVPDYRIELARSRNNLGILLVGQGNLAEAEGQYKKGLAILEKLVADFPNVFTYGVDLGGHYRNYGVLVNKTGMQAESIKWFDKAINILSKIHELNPHAVKARQFLWNSHVSRARAYTSLGKNIEAVKDWDRVVELGSKDEQPQLRAARASAKLKAGQVHEAVAEVAELRKLSNWDADQLYDFACIYSLALGKLADKQAEYANAAVALLTQAVKAGYKDAVHMKQDTDLAPLRERDDFKKLLADLEKVAPLQPKEPAPAPKEKK